MSETGPQIGRCRHCALAHDAVQCPDCGDRRLVTHPELDRLSIAHVDCDAFFASVEKRDNPKIADKPVIVGGGTRGVVSAACYHARVYGVRSAMPMFKALKLCPQAVVIKPSLGKYGAEGRRIKAMMSDLTPAVEPLSVDEAFLDLTGTQRLHGRTPAQSLILLQRRVLEEVGVTVSVGLSYNKFLAKTASDLDKPHGFAVLGRADAQAFLRDKPVEFIYGIGPSFAKKLNAHAIYTIADVRKLGDKTMAKRFGDIGLHLSRLSRAEDNRRVSPGRARKSVSSETTFNTDISDIETLKDQLWVICQKTSDRAKGHDIAGRVVTLKLKGKDFKSITRRRTMAQPVQLADTIFKTLEPLLEAEATGRAFRLIGAGITDLTAPVGDAGDLLDPSALRRGQAERASDKAREKFGAGAVMTGRQLRAMKVREARKALDAKHETKPKD